MNIYLIHVGLQPMANYNIYILQMTMVLFETLRLHSPALFMKRKTMTDMKVGSMKLPKGIAIVIPIPIIHREKVVWGEHADEFNPLRFENGISGAAKVPHGQDHASVRTFRCWKRNRSWP